MKKALIISHSFPPYNVIGAQRPYNLAKYFPKFGWEPIVLTVKRPGKPPDGIKIIQSDYKDNSMIKAKFGFSPEWSMHKQLDTDFSKNGNYSTLKKNIIRLFRDIITFPDDRKRWYNSAVKAASKFLDKEKVDAIVSTSPPIISHLIANKLKKRYQIPWIADMRDPWSLKYIDNRFGLLRYIDRHLEIKTLSEADALVSVTIPYVEMIRTHHKDKKMFCITNGFDPDDFNKTPSKLTDKFTITYTGTLYEGKRDPSLLFQALIMLINEKKIDRNLIEIRFYDQKQRWLIEAIKKNNLEGVVTVYDRISRDEVLERQRESQLLLLIRWKTNNEGGDCPAKIYEYIGSKRPIIAIGGYGGIIKDLLDTTNAGKFADNVETLKDNLFEYYLEYLKCGKVVCQSNEKIKNYSYVSVAHKYSDILNRLVSGNMRKGKEVFIECNEIL